MKSARPLARRLGIHMLVLNMEVRMSVINTDCLGADQNQESATAATLPKTAAVLR